MNQFIWLIEQNKKDTDQFCVCLICVLKCKTFHVLTNFHVPFNSERRKSSRHIILPHRCFCTWHSKMSIFHSKSQNGIPTSTALLMMKIAGLTLVWWIFWTKPSATLHRPWRMLGTITALHVVIYAAVQGFSQYKGNKTKLFNTSYWINQVILLFSGQKSFSRIF